MVRSLRIIMALMAAGITLATQSISLSNFTPRIENLPISCQNAYQSAIQGCTKDDFAPNARCSSTCIQGLNRITTVVTTNCKSVNVPETSIIGVFLRNKGVEALCPDVQLTTSSSARPPPQTSSRPPPPPPSTTTSSSQAEDTPDPSSSSSAQSTDSQSARPTATSSSTDTAASASSSSSSSADRPQLSTDTGSPPPAPTPTDPPQRSNQNPGGGSPFDIGASAPAPQLRLSGITLLAMFGITMVPLVAL